MNIKKRIQGMTVEIEFEKIKEYDKYDLYQVYRIKNGIRIPLYKECFTDMDLDLIHKNKCIINEEVFEL